jgi:hypothetical protein
MDNECLVVLWEAHDGYRDGKYKGKRTMWKLLHIGIWFLDFFIDDIEYSN